MQGVPAAVKTLEGPFSEKRRYAFEREVQAHAGLSSSADRVARTDQLRGVARGECVSRSLEPDVAQLLTRSGELAIEAGHAERAKRVLEPARD
jgi:hypothetical protein